MASPAEETSPSFGPRQNEAEKATSPASRPKEEDKGKGKEIEKVKQVTAGVWDDEVCHDEGPSKLDEDKAWCLGLGAKLGHGGEIKVLFETPSGFAIFSFDGVKLIEPNAIEEHSAKRAVWLKGFQTFEDKASTIHRDTGVNEKLAEMIKCCVEPGQILAVGKREYQDIISEKLGITCMCNDEVMELMWGLKRHMNCLVPGEKSELPKEDCLSMCEGMKIVLRRCHIDVEPEMVTEEIMQLTGLVYECDFCVNKHAQYLRQAGRHLKEVSSINFEGWDLMKLATALLMVALPNGKDIVAGNLEKLFGDDYETLLKDAPKYEDKLYGIICNKVYGEMLSARKLRFRALKLLRTLVAVAKTEYNKAEQARRSQE